jgi:Na+/proline symporter
MWRILAEFGSVSGIAAFLINLIPDMGDRALIFMLFGFLFFGIFWAKMGVMGMVLGMGVGVLIATANTVIVTSIETQLASTP